MTPSPGKRNSQSKSNIPRFIELKGFLTRYSDRSMDLALILAARRKIRE